jgi:hypothetical protein
VFDVDLWDEGVYDLESDEYKALRARIVRQIMMIFSIFRRLFPSNVDEAPSFSDDRRLQMPNHFAWKKLDMAILESPCKPVVKHIANRDPVPGIKHSFHLRFPFVRIDYKLMFGINAFLINRLEAECPRIQDSDAPRLANSWYEALDAKVIASGIKLPGSQKAVKCPQCFAIVQQEKTDERLAKAKRHVAHAHMPPPFRSRTQASAHPASEADERAAERAPKHDAFNEDKLNLNTLYVQSLNRQDF